MRYALLIFFSLSCRDKIAKTIHCSNVHDEQKEWPQCKVLAFGNSPPQIPLEKVKDGRQKFEQIIHQDQSKEELVDNLMELLQDRKRYAWQIFRFRSGFN